MSLLEINRNAIIWSMGPYTTATWAGINDPCNHTVCSLPSIIVRGPAVTQNKSQLVHVMNEVWYSDAFAPKFVLIKVFSNYLLESDDGITINRDI